ncbi:MAG: hypothetical protein KA230_09655 [Flavobacteriales bacterium]|nr:hypothetical protein [Flavobacteriales bacterium]MBP6644075.1 hypothetical protein [Flavobacteriales bacterium]
MKGQLLHLVSNAPKDLPQCWEAYHAFTTDERAWTFAKVQQVPQPEVTAFEHFPFPDSPYFGVPGPSIAMLVEHHPDLRWNTVLVDPFVEQNRIGLAQYHVGFTGDKITELRRSFSNGRCNTLRLSLSEGPFSNVVPGGDSKIHLFAADDDQARRMAQAEYNRFVAMSL